MTSLTFNIKVMENQIFIGIDISKKTLDICILEEDEKQYASIENKKKEINKFLNTFSDEREVYISMENTGRYNWPLYTALSSFEHCVFVIPPLHLKKSLGLIRGKNDKVDAERIAVFTKKNLRDLRPWKAPSQNLQKLKVLLAERSLRMKMKSQLLSNQKEYELIAQVAKECGLAPLNQRMVKSLKAQIEKIEERIENLISSDESLLNTSELIRSVPGVGKVLCWMMIAKTNNFISITDPRKMACFAGVVPFQFRSGTSVIRKDRVSLFADKSLKKHLHLGAMSAIRLNNDLRKYYLRKTEEGKNKMSVLNAVRNKIIHRVYAVIKNQRQYQNHLILS